MRGYPMPAGAALACDASMADASVSGLTVSGATRVACVIGDPVEHSRSPRMHNAASAALGLDRVYVALRRGSRRPRRGRARPAGARRRGRQRHVAAQGRGRRAVRRAGRRGPRRGGRQHAQLPGGRLAARRPDATGSAWSLRWRRCRSAPSCSVPAAARGRRPPPCCGPAPGASPSSRAGSRRPTAWPTRWPISPPAPGRGGGDGARRSRRSARALHARRRDRCAQAASRACRCDRANGRRGRFRLPGRWLADAARRGGTGRRPARRRRPRVARTPGSPLVRRWTGIEPPLDVMRRAARGE